MQIIRLEPPIWLNTPRGDGLAIFFSHIALDHNDVWTVVIKDTGEIWNFENSDVRVCKNITYGINLDDTYPPEWTGHKLP